MFFDLYSILSISRERIASYFPSSCLHTFGISSCFFVLPLYLSLPISINTISFLPFSLRQVIDQTLGSATLTSASKSALSPQITVFGPFIKISGTSVKKTNVQHMINNRLFKLFCVGFFSIPSILFN